ncbi:MAG: NAD-dependent deacylase [Halieaceae bacterium]|jgi:NAD-dependent deacetylase|nr:NAD-dependent deacylase [Halieaceae bacterium]
MNGLKTEHWHNIVVLTGAGISAESGLGTFRGAGGLWEQHRVEEVATPEAFAADPAMVYRFYNARRAQLAEAEPNAAHRALAEMERRWQGGFALVTQNVDNLHRRAGSTRVYSMHGELDKMRCQRSGSVLDAPVYFDSEHCCSCCGVAGSLRPHVVWFGEVPLFMDEITALLAHCDLFVAIGTSSTVYPAAGFVALAREAGATTLEINPEPTEASSRFHHHWRGRATELVPKLADLLLSSP